MAMNIRKTSETASKMTLEWDPVPGAAAGYRGRDVSVEKWTQTQQTKMTFAKGASVEIQALGVADSGTYPTTIPPPPAQDYDFRYAKIVEVTGCFNRFANDPDCWWVPGTPEGDPWPKGGGIREITHPTYGPGFDMMVTDEMLYAGPHGPRNSNLVRFVATPPSGSPLRVPVSGTTHTWNVTLMRPSGYTWPTGFYESIWQQGTNVGGYDHVGHHLFLNNGGMFPGFNYYFGRQTASGPIGPNYWSRTVCPVPLNADEYHSIRWEILWSDPGAPNGSIKAWTSVNGGPEQQWLNLTNIASKLAGFSQVYDQMISIRTPYQMLSHPPLRWHMHNLRVGIA